eukprot:gnl/MRDRNA2_/MRDRNA2_183086_c0_seq1.p1 gnl/MRDRNA2_/MRDRNA2_183086_c0~~gnl/MRDRNA2_/MRDRNA2_183086_c0_seq1.p1  ORF type:complete len:676 (+),score=136.94 gnl/MRDRNA2_/MRDRNA2_183086_c0_seq1:179-2029(+)
MAIDRSHTMPLLWNVHGLVLSTKDETTIREVASHVCRLRYCGHHGQMQKEMARYAAGLLPSEIVKFLTEIRDGNDTHGRFRLYSAHDNSLMAMLAHLGFKDFDVPEFAAFLAFELHRYADGSWYVRFMFNPDPQKNSFPCTKKDNKTCTESNPLKYIKLPEQKACDTEAPVIAIGAAEEGEMPLDKFIEILMQERRSFADQEQWNLENPCGLEMALTHDLEVLKQKEEVLQQKLEQTEQRQSLIVQCISSAQLTAEMTGAEVMHPTNSPMPSIVSLPKADENMLILLRTMTEVNVLVSNLPSLMAMSVCSRDGATVTLEFLANAARSTESDSLLERALVEGRQSKLTGEALTEEICDRIIVLAVCDILGGTTSMVIIETGAHLGFDIDHTTSKIQKLVRAIEACGFQRDRVMFDLGCTWEATQAAAVLQGHGIQCSLSLVFSFCQAAAAADAGVSLILIPFKHMTEWWERNDADHLVHESNPGVLLMMQTYSYLKYVGSKTRVGGTMLQSVDEILAIAGCDTITVTPELVEELHARPGPVIRHLDSNLKDPDVEVISSFSVYQGEPAFRKQLNANALATEKLAQGIRESQRHLDKLRHVIQQKLQDIGVSSNLGSP